MRRAAPLVLVLAVAAAVLLVTEVSPGELALFGLFELGFVLLPGLAVHAALARERGDLLERVAIGAGVGHALLLAWFVVTAAAGVRWALWLLPVAGLAVAVAVRDRFERPRLDLSPGQAWALAAVAVVALGLLTAAFFVSAPLPGTTATVSYYPDLMFGLGLAAEALHHWPMTAPQVLGEPLHYHTFAFMDMAATSRQSGIELPVVMLRLFPISILLTLVAQLAHAGRRFGGSRWAAPVAAALVLLVGDLDLGLTRTDPLVGLYFSGLYLSASQALGMVMFLPTLVVVADLLEAVPRRPRWSSVLLLAILLFGCAGAKATILPVLIAGLVACALWTRRGDAAVAACLAVCGVAFAASYLLLYKGGRTGADLHLLKSAFRSIPGKELEPSTGGSLKRAAAYPVATWVTAVALMVPLAGLAFARIEWRRPSVRQAWPLGLLAASVGAYFAFDLPGQSQLYFLWYGFTAAALLAAGGLTDAIARRGLRVVGPLAAGAVVGVVLGLGAPMTSHTVLRAYTVGAALLGAVAVVYALVWKRGLPAWPAAVAVGALLAAGMVDGPADRLPHLGYHRADPKRERGVTRDLVQGLDWVRDHTSENAVLAVNNHIRRPQFSEALYFYYSALAERRVFVEAWEYTDEALLAGTAASRAGRHPFARRAALNDDMYAGTDPEAAMQLRRRGVDYVLVDRVNAPPPRNRIPGVVVFRNPALIVYRLP